ncbi:MAG: BBP7 family outer membrane beta-barrel protein [Thermoguttaceae bacterium]
MPETLGYPQGGFEPDAIAPMPGVPGMAGGRETCGEDGGPCQGGPCGPCEGGACCDDLLALFGALPLHDRLYFHGDALVWWTKSADVPPLATGDPDGTQTVSKFGVLGEAGTTTLFPAGGGGVDLGARAGSRFTLGYWLCPCEDSGIEATYLALGGHSLDFSASNVTDPILARPFFNVLTNAQDSFPVAFPSQYTGNVDIAVGNELASLELLYRRAMLKEGDFRLDFLAGYRYGWFSENLFVGETLTATAPPVAGPVTYLDRFSADNRFNGVEMGFDMQTRAYRWSLDMAWKLAMGDTFSRVFVEGRTNGLPVGGILALPSNMGTFEQNNFSVIPELDLTLGYDITPRLKVTVGYSFFYWSQVGRPGNQVDTNLNPNQFPGQVPPPSGPASPPPEKLGLGNATFATTDFWAQGLNFGINYQF